MRRFSPDDPFDDGPATQRPSRVTRLADLLGDDEAGEPRHPKRAGASQRTETPQRAEPPRRTVSHGSATPCEAPQPRRVPPVAPREGGDLPTILSVTPDGEGETLAVVMVLPHAPSPAEAPQEGGQTARRVRLHLLVEQYADLRAEGVSLECGDISPRQAELVLEAGELCDAIRRGIAALQYGDRSARRLVYGLTAKGVDREKAEAAAAYLARKGYIREEDTARRRVGCDLRKGWGPRRIREDLRAQGLDPEAVDAAMEELAQVDFSEICAEIIRKRYGAFPAERGPRQKIIAALMRLGYNLDHIRGAARLLDRHPS